MMAHERHILAGETAGQLALPGPAGEPLPSDRPKRGWLDILWRRKLIVLVGVLVAAGGGLAYVETAPQVYQGSSRIRVEASGPRIMSADESRGSLAGNFLNTECAIIQSGPVLAAAIETPGVKTLRTFANAPSPIGVLAENLSAGIGKGNDLITVAFESEYPEDIPAVVNAVVDAYKDFQSTSKKTSAGEVLKILQGEKSKRDAEMTEKFDAMLKYKQEHPELGFQGEKGNVIIQRLERLSTALTESELEVVEAQAELEAIENLKGDPAQVRQYVEARRFKGSVFVSTQDEGARLEAELNALEMQKTALGREYATSNPSVKALPAVQAIDDRIKKINELITRREKQFADMQLAATAQHYRATTQRAGQIQKDHASQLQKALGLNEVLAAYAKLESEYEQTRKLVELIAGRMKELNVTGDVGALNISVLERASTPGKPIKPKHMQILAMAVAGGLLLGVGLALLLDNINPRLRSELEISAALGAPVIGALPILKGRKELEGLGQKVLRAPRSPMAEAFRGIRTALTFGQPGARVKTILVTSPAPGDGKSTLISNLAIAMSQAGRRVLVLDADFHRPHQHKIFALAAGAGLSSVLEGKAPLEEAIRRQVVPGLDVLPAGPTPSHPAELLNSQAFHDLLEGLAGSYDQILIDSAPVLAATDALVLAAQSDLTLLVVRAEQTYRRMAEQARDGLASVGARCFGAVANAVPRNGKRYGHYGQGYYHKEYARAESAAATQAAPGAGDADVS